MVALFQKRTTNINLCFQTQIVDQKKKNSGGNNPTSSISSYGTGNRQKSLGPRRGLNSPFILPVKDAKQNETDNNGVGKKSAGNSEPEKEVGTCFKVGDVVFISWLKFNLWTDERLKNIEPRMIELIENEIMDNGAPVNWDDIAGLEFAKNTIKEIVVWPMLRPDIFTGLRGPPRGKL